jgi:hypothetical protein
VQRTQAIVIQADAAGNEVRVKLCLTRRANQFGEIAPGQRFASGKTDLQNAKRGGFTDDPVPFSRRELAIVCCSVRCPQRIGPGSFSAGDSGPYSRRV